MIVERFLKAWSPNRRAINPKTVGIMTWGIQAGIPRKVMFPIWASFLINFNAAKVNRQQMKKENS
jgi:hypothetical protein